MNNIDKVLYTGRTITTGGRDGVAKSDDDRLNVQLSSPGSKGAGTNPEQLFAAGWSACFIGAMMLAAREHRITLPAETAVHAEVDLGTGDGGYLLQARLNVSLPGLSSELGQQIVDYAHANCPYSKMSRGNIDVSITLA